MHIKTIVRPVHSPFEHPHLKRLTNSSTFLKKPQFAPNFNGSFLPPLRNTLTPKARIVTAYNGLSQELTKIVGVNDENDSSFPSFREEQEVEIKGEKLVNQNIWNQMKEIVMFTGPATGLWICGPLMSLIDTIVIGQGSSIELAALGPGTVLCDYMSYTFMFLSIATSNMVATSLATKDRNEVQHQISLLLFVGLTAGLLMLLFTSLFGSQALTAFIGPKNSHILPAANSDVQPWHEGLWGPLKALVVASAINITGDIVLCSMLGYGIAGAAWATMASQVVSAFVMINTLSKGGYNPYAISVPSPDDLLMIFGLAAPVFVTMMSKVAFFSLVIYFATSMGTLPVAAHQVMIQTFHLIGMWGEPLSQTSLSFMPELMYGINRSMAKAQMLLKSLVIIGAILGLILRAIGTSIPWLFPNFYTSDLNVIREMHKVLVPFFLAVAVTPCTVTLEGTLLAGRDLKFISLSMSGCFSLAALVLLLVSSRGYGLPGCWYAILGFQWARFFLALQRLLSPNGILSSPKVCAIIN